MKKLILSVSLSFLFLFSFNSGDEAFAQQRNPVLEYCTGTWCPNCPAGHQIINNTILPNIPNAIIIGYHGPANGSDPFSFFPGNSIINTLLRQGTSTYYPTGTIDRTSGVQSRSAWYGYMNTRNSVPATVDIDVNRSFNSVTREFNATIDFTALTNLNDQFMFNAILLESGMVWAQSGGTSNYVHKHVVRAMMNGALGEEVINGTWNQNDVITKILNYTVPIPGGPGPDIIWDSCEVVVMVYKVGSPLNSNAEIQQAVEMELISPDYRAQIYTTSPLEVIKDINTPVVSNAVIKNTGLLEDKYYMDCNFDAPTGWAGEFTTENGTFPFGQTDSVQVASGDSTEITITVNPNGIGGFGETTLEFSSANGPGIGNSLLFRNVTTTGVDILVIDASEGGYGSVITNSLENVYNGTYGIVSREVLQDPGADLSNFLIMAWSSGIALPAFYPEEVTHLQSFLDGGGRLFINGQNIGQDIFETNGQSQFAQEFYNNYLHSEYLNDQSYPYVITGFSGDPITDGIQFQLGAVYAKSVDWIAPFNSDAVAIFEVENGPEITAIRAETVDYRVVYLALGLEQIDETEIRDTLMARAINWLMEGTTSVDDNNLVVYSYSLKQNYPNPFNPSTTISYSLANEEHISLKIYDIMGREVADLVNEDQAAGTYSLNFDASSLASGMYFYKISAGNFVSTKKMVLLK